MTNSANKCTGVVPTLDAAALLTAAPGLSELNLKITAQSFRGLPGASLSFDVSQLVVAVQEELDADTDGSGNLLTAIQAAASTGLTGVGCVVLMADETQAAFDQLF